MPAFQLCLYLLPEAEPAAAPGKHKKPSYWKQDTIGSDTSRSQSHDVGSNINELAGVLLIGISVCCNSLKAAFVKPQRQPGSAV